MIIGIAGYMGSGKSTLAKMLSDKFGIVLLDADVIARTLMNENSSIIESVSEIFGVVTDGGIDFPELGKIVFSDPKSLDQLNSIVHPILIDELNQKASHESAPVIIDAALLTLWAERINLDHGIWVNASVDTRTERIMSRTGLTKDVTTERIRSQLNLFSPVTSDSWIHIANNNEIDSAYEATRQAISSWV